MPKIVAHFHMMGNFRHIFYMYNCHLKPLFCWCFVSPLESILAAVNKSHLKPPRTQMIAFV